MASKTDEDKKILAEMNQKIQSTFKEELGQLMDILKAGFGNNNNNIFENTNDDITQN